ncbi:MAG: hypothetical protein ABSH31_13900 [Bryobacteraceae bacterium]|jgi:hypothetical protein
MEPAPDSLPARPGPEQESGEAKQVVRRVEITLEREITTVIRRRGKGFSEAGVPGKPSINKDRDTKDV